MKISLFQSTSARSLEAKVNTFLSLCQRSGHEVIEVKYLIVPDPVATQRQTHHAIVVYDGGIYENHPNSTP